MSQIDELVKSLFNTNAFSVSKLGVDEARQVYENISANPSLNPDDLLPYFELFDSKAQRLISHLFDPRYENLRSFKQMETADTINAPKPIFAEPYEDVNVNVLGVALYVGEPPLEEMGLELVGFNPSLVIQALVGGNTTKTLSIELLSAVEAFDAYKNYMDRYKNSNELNALISAAEFLAETANAMARIKPLDPAMLSVQQKAQYSFFEKVVGLCEQAKEHHDFQEPGEHTLEVYRIKRGAKINMEMLNALRATDEEKGGKGSNGSTAPENGSTPLGSFGVGSGMAAVSIPFQTALCTPYVAQSMEMASALSFASLALPVF